MIRKKIQFLFEHLSYLLYIKYYGINDLPFKQTELHVSDTTNAWNLKALSTDIYFGKIRGITYKSDEQIKISNRNNEWNKMAIMQD